jgi:hypothetical protein
MEDDDPPRTVVRYVERNALRSPPTGIGVDLVIERATTKGRGVRNSSVSFLVSAAARGRDYIHPAFDNDGRPDDP